MQHGKYLESTTKLFRYYKRLAEQSIDQLDAEDLYWEYDEGCNCIAVIIKHLSGNMISRFTDFLTSDGEKFWRNRDAEFVLESRDSTALMNRWQEGWRLLFGILENLQETDLTRSVFIRNTEHLVFEAINRQLAHYAYHVGQIVLMAKMKQGKSWTSLSIAPGASAEYNDTKFSEPQSDDHFTDEFFT